MSYETLSALRDGILFYILLVCSISIHEWAHAFTADKLNDPLPRLQGRVTLNPLAHMDLVGTVIIPLAMILMPIFTGSGPLFALIGWGKPVMISLPNPKTRTRDDLLITAAGPLSNLLLCFLIAIVIGLSGSKLINFSPLFIQALLINAALFAFNLIPIPPLDGAHFLKHAIRMSDETYMTLSRYSFIILLILINFQPFRIFLGKIIQYIVSFFIFLSMNLKSSIAGIF